MTYPPSGQDPYQGQGEPQQPGADQGGWHMPAPEPTQPLPQPNQTQPIYPQSASPDFYGQQGQPQQQQPYPGQQPYVGENPYAPSQSGQYPQQQGDYPYGQPGQPQPPYAYGAGYSAPPPPPTASGSKNAMIAVVIAVALLAGGFSAYWFGFHDKNPKPSPIALGSTLPATSAAPSDTGGATGTPAASDSAIPAPTDTTAAQIAALQALMATMNDQGCKSAFQAIITFEQRAGTDAGNDTAIITDYDTAISSLEAAQNQAQNPTAAAAIGQVVTDWKSYTAALAGGQTPDDSVMTADGQALAQACLAT